MKALRLDLRAEECDQAPLTTDFIEQSQVAAAVFWEEPNERMLRCWIGIKA
jgi:hypothetical protein